METFLLPPCINPALVVKELTPQPDVHRYSIKGDLGTPCTRVFRLETYYFSITLPAKFFASSTFASRMSHIALDLFARTFGTIWILFKASCSVSLLTSTNRIATSNVSREIFRGVKASNSSGMVINSLPFVNSAQFFF